MVEVDGVSALRHVRHVARLAAIHTRVLAGTIYGSTTLATPMPPTSPFALSPPPTKTTTHVIACLTTLRPFLSHLPTLRRSSTATSRLGSSSTPSSSSTKTSDTQYVRCRSKPVSRQIHCSIGR